MKNIMKKIILASALLLGSSSAMASFINVGGVIWDPGSVSVLPSLIDFTSNGAIFENATNGIPGDLVSGRGKVERINSALNNEASFCPGCELTYTFSMNLVSVTPISGVFAAFEFTSLVINFFVDDTPNFDGTAASAGDGSLWLSLAGLGNLTGAGSNIGTGSDVGSGNALLNVVGGLAAANFDTNTKLNGADMVLSSSFQPTVATENGRQLLTGTFDLTGNSIPEPTSLALLGIGLLGFGASRVRKQA